MGVFAAERGDVNRLRFWFSITFVMGSVFVAGQVYEYAELLHEGLTFSGDRLRLGLLPDHRLPRPARHRRSDRLPVRARPHLHGASGSPTRRPRRAIVVSYYWHFVDVVWIALFAMIYILK